MKPRPEKCENCGAALTQSGHGRPRQYCDNTCGKAARNARGNSDRDTHEEHLKQTRQVAEALKRQSAALHQQLSHEITDEAWTHLLRRVHSAEEELRDLRTCLVQVTRDRGIPQARIAEAWEINASRISRDWPEDRYDGRMRSRSRRIEARARRFLPPQATGAGDETGDSASRPRQTGKPPAPDTGKDADRADTGNKALSQLNTALSCLLRSDASRTVASLARAAGVSRSHVSRILAGNRFPSWKVTTALVTACDGSTDDIRPLWQAAHDSLHATPRRTLDGTLHTVLRGLYLAACRPPTATIRSASPTLTYADISGLLEGAHVPAWHVVKHLVLALHGQPDMVRPLWETAAHTPNTRTEPPAPARIPLAPFC
ncbi:helix-turn-helix transcriptional regulator [Streptomyces sp. NPDC007025]|uniref:helix-turn-helix transcriptional regulator n=1 Tax=Streptomyces sp. NPDC007025 TaxID=3364771 RepID=UPI0036853321